MNEMIDLLQTEPRFNQLSVGATEKEKCLKREVLLSLQSQHEGIPFTKSLRNENPPLPFTSGSVI